MGTVRGGLGVAVADGAEVEVDVEEGRGEEGVYEVALELGLGTGCDVVRVRGACCP